MFLILAGGVVANISVDYVVVAGRSTGFFSVVGADRLRNFDVYVHVRQF